MQNYSGQAAIAFSLTACLLASIMLFHQLNGSKRSREEVRLQEKLNSPVIFKQDAWVRRAENPFLPLDHKVRKYDKALLTGTGKTGTAEISINGVVYYVDPSLIVVSQAGQQALGRQQVREARQESDKAALIEKHRQELLRLESMQEKQAENEAFLEENDLVITVSSSTWDGSKLDRTRGVNAGPSGKETYYNLPMEGVISIMRSIGNQDPYWVREDGVKMLGDYVMVAAHLGLRPRGSLVPTSLGMGIVCDTGTFALTNPTQLDIAVDWK